MMKQLNKLLLIAACAAMATSSVLAQRLSLRQVPEAKCYYYNNRIWFVDSGGNTTGIGTNALDWALLNTVTSTTGTFTLATITTGSGTRFTVTTLTNTVAVIGTAGVTTLTATTGTVGTLTNTTGVITTLGVTGLTATTATITTNAATYLKLGATTYTLGVSTNVDASGAVTNLLLKLQQIAPE